MGRSALSDVGRIGRFVRQRAKKAVLWLGPPLSGKDTQTDLMEAMGFPVFQTGPELKKTAKKNPGDSRYTPIFRGELADDDITIWTAKVWVVKQIKNYPDHEIIHLNGIPRNREQFGRLMGFLIERGYQTKVVWFSTPIHVCSARPDRPGREDMDPTIKQRRFDIYIEQTQPILALLPPYKITEANGNLLKVDNTDLTQGETTKKVSSFLGLQQEHHSHAQMAPATRVVPFGIPGFREVLLAR